MRNSTIILFILFSQRVFSQNVDNPSFDSVYIGGIDRIYDWVTSDTWPLNGDTVTPLNPNTHYDNTGLMLHALLYSVQLEYSGAYDGPYAIKVLADSNRVDISGQPSPGFIINGDHVWTNANGYPDLAKCGTPFPYRPDKLRGHYKFVDNSPSLSNYPNGLLLLKKYNTVTQQSDTIGYGSLSMQLFPTANWRLFEMPITYLSNLVPDSIVVAFFAPRLAYISTFSIDSLGFEYASTAVDELSNTSEVNYYIEANNLHIMNEAAISSITIFDIQGKQLISCEGKAEVDLSQLSRGTFLLSFHLKNGMKKSYKIYR